MLRPLAGFWFLNIPKPTPNEDQRIGFRPLAGFWFLNPEGCRSPSRLHGRSFRPLAGVPILASPVATGEVASNASRWGRLCLACTSDAMKVYNLRSWRPLHRLRGPPPPLWQGRLEVRSVPLRGSGS